MLVVTALGGNAILQRGEPLEAFIQRRNIETAAKALAPIANQHALIITHGNGPQVGLLALKNEAYDAVENYPLDNLGAQTAGMIGYEFVRALRNEQPNKSIANILTQTIVDPSDPAFANPDKYIGPVYNKEQAEAIAQSSSHVMKADGEYYRRVVPSPMPQGIVELDTIKMLCDAGSLLVCGGGGGIPLRKDEDGLWHGVEAVVDKDRTSSLLAGELNADLFLILTDVASVATNWGAPDSREIRKARPEQLDQFGFSGGSMGPKVEAVCDFVRRTGKKAAIGSLTQATAIIEGRSGTTIDAQHVGEIEYY